MKYRNKPHKYLEALIAEVGSANKLARILNVRKTLISGLRRGVVSFSLRMALACEKLSHGRYPAHYFRPQIREEFRLHEMLDYRYFKFEKKD